MTRTYAPHTSFGTTIVAAAAAAIAVGILSTVVYMFQSQGTPMEQLVAAERACKQHQYVSEREQCMNEWVAAARAMRVARK